MYHNPKKKSEIYKKIREPNGTIIEKKTQEWSLFEK